MQISAKSAVFQPVFFNSYRKLACQADGWQTVPLKGYRQILNQIVTPMIIIYFGIVTEL